jgi:DNA polymerase-1
MELDLFSAAVLDAGASDGAPAPVATSVPVAAPLPVSAPSSRDVTEARIDEAASPVLSTSPTSGAPVVASAMPTVPAGPTGMPPKTRPRVFLIDGYALIYRAFYAMVHRPLRNKAGDNTSSAWGVANFLVRLREKYRPDYLIWVHDAGDSNRKAMYPAYKATREKLEGDMLADFQLALRHTEQLLAAMHVPLVTVPGYEADDVVGTLAVDAKAKGWEAVIVSGDKDFAQLVCDGIALLNPGRSGPAGTDEQWVDLRNGHERLGVPPSKVIDFLALIGDSSDNVPGVKGIGEKGAIELLRAHGTLEEILAQAATITKKRPREALLAQGEAARLSKQLVTIQCHVPHTVDLEAARVQPFDPDALGAVLGALEFTSLARRLGVMIATPAATPEWFESVDL